MSGASPEHRDPAQPRPSTVDRGYDARHQREARACIIRQPWCTWCQATDDLTADHIVPGQPKFGYQTLCRPCNTRRRNGSNGPATP